MRKTLLTIVVLFLVILFWLFLRKPEKIDLNISPDQQGEVPTTTSTGFTLSQNSIVVDLPKTNSTTTSPINLSGKARGNWFFEASAPVQVVDDKGNVLGQSHVEATGDWMTTEFVPFTGSVVYKNPTGTTTKGFVVFSNDNPSGDPERSVSVKIPINFKR
ncbi:MAG: hypothetical protein AB200_00585 [Parcubacteria bacterium C7867-005]|nr:MAG: hypothetical protein AB200_00585 [Parcubacteria bacterium C7867-005]